MSLGVDFYLEITHFQVFSLMFITSKKHPPNIVYRPSAPKLLDRLKCESKVKIMEEQRIGARSLAHSTLGVEGCARALGWYQEE
jgi:hypothetical protein